MPGATGWSRPRADAGTIASRFGVRAASSGVCPPRTGSGRSPTPSRTRSTILVVASSARDSRTEGLIATSRGASEAARPSASERAQEFENGRAFPRRELLEAVPRSRRLAVVQLDRLLDGRGGAVVHELVAKPKPHEGLGAELGRLCEAEANVGTRGTHVVEQEIGVGVHLLVAQRAHRIVSGGQTRRVA